MADIRRRGRGVFVFQISDRHIHPPSSTMLKPRLEVVDTQIHGDVPLIKVSFSEIFFMKKGRLFL